MRILETSWNGIERNMRADHLSITTVNPSKKCTWTRSMAHKTGARSAQWTPNKGFSFTSFLLHHRRTVRNRRIYLKCNFVEAGRFYWQHLLIHTWNEILCTRSAMAQWHQLRRAHNKLIGWWNREHRWKFNQWKYTYRWFFTESIQWNRYCVSFFLLFFLALPKSRVFKRKLKVESI